MIERMQVEYRAPGDLVPYARNAREHSEAQVSEIAESIRRFGFANPILVGEDAEVIAGHGRLAAAKALGLAEVPVIVLRGLGEVERRQLVLADNRIALNAGWDVDMLRLELSDLAAMGADLSGLGFDEAELAKALAPAGGGLTDPDEAPDVPVEPVSRKGDLWICGTHRLLCGDSTDAKSVERLLDGAAPHLMVTDPPYGVAYDPSWRKRAGVSMNAKKMGVVLNDDRADWSEAWSLFPGSIAYVWHGGLHAGTVLESLEATGFAIRAQIIWVKERFALGRGDYHWQHEPCWYGVRGKGNWTGDRKQTTVWPINARDDKGHGHGTQKPVECMRRPIVNNSKPGDAVYEPFCGSGTTMIAAEMEGRHAYCMELSEAYCDVIVRRWQAFTGKEATLDAADRPTFAAVERSRAS